MRILETVKIENFKSIRRQQLALGRLNVFIGGNGAGKSNLVQAFRFLREIVQQNLAGYSLQRGADNLLYFGRKTSKYMVFDLDFGDGTYGNGYYLRLTPTDEGALMVNNEVVWFHERSRWKDPLESLKPGSCCDQVKFGAFSFAGFKDSILARRAELRLDQEPDVVESRTLVGPRRASLGETLGQGSKEAAVATSSSRIAGHVRQALDGYRLYHFHDTSDAAPVKAGGPVDDNRFLRSDASNLAAFLYVLQRQHSDHFRNIEDVVRQIAPFFERFNLEPSRLAPDQIRLEWKEKGSDAYFNAASLSDGTLRFMCLATLLLQPTLPALVLLDEPELGLHPAAVSLLADLLSSAATRRQVLVATQSVTLVNQFEPEQVWTVDRVGGRASFSTWPSEISTSGCNSTAVTKAMDWANCGKRTSWGPDPNETRPGLGRRRHRRALRQGRAAGASLATGDWTSHRPWSRPSG